MCNTIFENRNWKCVEPLSYDSSLKLITGKVKWCSLYENYYRSLKIHGKLIYCINKHDVGLMYGLHIKKDGSYELLNTLGYRLYPINPPWQIHRTDKIKMPLYILRKLLQKN